MPSPGPRRAFNVGTVLAGLKYVLETRLLLGSISLDLFAVLLGGAVALMPIFAQSVLHAGPKGLGFAAGDALDRRAGGLAYPALSGRLSVALEG